MSRAGSLAAALLMLAGACGGTTDPANLPGPGGVIQLLERGGSGSVAVTTDGAADARLRPHVYPLAPVAAAHAVVDAIERLPRWEVVAGRDGVIWATRRNRLGFVDDIYLLLLPAHDSTAVLARSASRVGSFDFGQNRRNLGELWSAVQARVTARREANREQ